MYLDKNNDSNIKSNNFNVFIEHTSNISLCHNDSSQKLIKNKNIGASVLVKYSVESNCKFSFDVRVVAKEKDYYRNCYI